MTKIKIIIHEDERYPDYSMRKWQDDFDYDNEGIEVDEEDYNRFQKIQELYDELAEELRALLKRKEREEYGKEFK